MAIYIPQDVFWNRIKNLNLDYRGGMHVLAEDGRLIASDADTRPAYLTDGFFEDVLAQKPDNLGIRRFDAAGGYIGLVHPVGDTKFYLINEISEEKLFSRINQQLVYTLILVALCTGLFIFLAMLLARMVSGPIVNLTHTIQRVEKGEYALRTPVSGFLETRQLSDSFNQMNDTSNELLRKVEKEAALRAQTHFDALRAQINPHFLFNTLNSIKWMATLNADHKTADMIAELGRVLDHTLTRSKRMTTLGVELGVMRSYINIQMMRYGNSFTYIDNVPKDLHYCAVPKFILQPIIENAIIHGLVHAHDGFIKVSGRAADGDLELLVEDNGIGADSASIQRLLEGEGDEKNAHRYMTGVGVRNVHERLQMQFGKAYGLTIETSPGEGFSVTVRLPLIDAAGPQEGTNA